MICDAVFRYSISRQDFVALDRGSRRRRRGCERVRFCDCAHAGAAPLLAVRSGVTTGYGEAVRSSLSQQGLAGCLFSVASSHVV